MHGVDFNARLGMHSQMEYRALSHLYATLANRSYMASRFKLPKADALGHEWVNISYMQFQTDIEQMAKFWFTQLSAQDIPSQSVVGIWCVH